MELTEKERLKLIEKKEELLKVTRELRDITPDDKNAIEIKKKIDHIISIISTIASFTKTDLRLDSLTKLAEHIILTGESIGWENEAIMIDMFCVLVNSINFKFTRTSVTINIPKIDFNLIKNEFGGLLKK